MRNNRFILNFLKIILVCSICDLVSSDTASYMDASKSVAKKYRRFELTVANLMLTPSIRNNCKDEKPAGCKMKSFVDFNGMTHNRTIDLAVEHDVDDGIYLFHTIVWDGYDEEQESFNATNYLKIMLDISKDGKSYTNIYDENYINIVKAASNTERNLNVTLKDGETFGIYMHFRCMGYTGFNCQFECDTEKYDIECHYETGMVFCKKPTYLNPPFCNSTDTTCPADGLKCQNNGTCKKVFVNSYHCDCPSGYGGQLCEFAYCETPCDPDFGTCTGPNKCDCNVDYKGGNFCNITQCTNSICNNSGECSVHKNEIFCMCDRERYSGRYCEKVCPLRCVYGLCSYYDNETFCDCFEGFGGENCTVSVFQLSPIIQKGHISVRNQKIAYATTFFLLFIIAMVTFGVGSYIRNNIKRNIDIIKRTNETLTAFSQCQKNVQMQQPTEPGYTTCSEYQNSIPASLQKVPINSGSSTVSHKVVDHSNEIYN